VHFPVERYPARASLRPGAVGPGLEPFYPFELSIEIRIILESNPQIALQNDLVGIDQRLVAASTRNSFKHSVIVCPVACRFFYTELGASIRLNFSVDIGGFLNKEGPDS
jgi:hypothetical protein